MRQQTTEVCQRAESHRGELVRQRRPMETYRGKIGEYARDIFDIELTAPQLRAVELVETPPYKVIDRAGHSVGKTLRNAVWLSYLYDTRPACVILVTAPREETVKNTVWRELRKIRQHAVRLGKLDSTDFTGPRSLEMSSSEDHICLGTTATNSDAFQGKHEASVFVLMEEAGAVDPVIHEACDSMLQGAEYGIIKSLNPLSTACQVYRDESARIWTGDAYRPAYHVHANSCLEHPNILSELAGRGPVKGLENAVRLDWVRAMLGRHADQIDQADMKGNDFFFDGKCWHPKLEVESRVLGLWPSAGSDTIWSESAWRKCKSNPLTVAPNWPCTIGIDVARFGDDMTVFVVRRWKKVVHVEEHNGWDTNQIAGRAKSLCHQHHGSTQDERRVRCYIDDTGAWGGGVIDKAGDYTFIGVNASVQFAHDNEYYNLRTKLFFDTAIMADQGLIDCSGIEESVAEELRTQLMAQKYDYRAGTGQKWAVEKKEVKKALGRSPDLADAFNLCYYQGAPVGERVGNMGG